MKPIVAIKIQIDRFWIAQQAADTKYIADIAPVFKKAKELAGKRPNVLISDDAQFPLGLHQGILY